MPKDSHAQIRKDALAWSGEKATLELGRSSAFFDLLISEMDMERLFDEEVRPAFVEFAKLNNVSRWRCSVFYSQELRLSDDVLRELNTVSPSGIGMRFSSIFGPIGVLTGDDPYCVFLYNGASQNAFFVSRSWGSHPVVTRLKMSDLTSDFLVEELYAFSKILRQWELKHPAVSVGFEPYPQYGLSL